MSGSGRELYWHGQALDKVVFIIMFGSDVSHTVSGRIPSPRPAAP